MPDWIDYSSNLKLGTALERVFLKASYFKERLIVASAKGGVQTIPFYEKSNPVAQPTTKIKDICVNQEIKFNDYSIVNYTGAIWEWSFSKTPIYLNGMIDDGTLLMVELQRYFPIDYGSLPKSFIINDEIQKYPLHYFNHLFELSACV